MIAAIEWITGIAVYVICGGIVGGFVSYVSRNGRYIGSSDRGPVVGMTTAFWPIAIIVILATTTVMVSSRMGLRVGSAMGHARYATKIDMTRGRMMADDLERVGGNFDLIVNYDYLPCSHCYGGGCHHCAGEGVVRVKASL